MNWLLHQLQKVLGAISGHRSSSRPVSPTKEGLGANERSEGLAQPRANSDTATPAQPGISFSIQPDELVTNLQDADSSPDSTKDELDTDDFDTNNFDTSVRLDAAPSTIPDVSHDISSEKSTAVSNPEELSSPSQTTESSDPEQLPSIQDLLPAVEQEIKDNSAAYSEQERIDSSAASDMMGANATSLNDVTAESVESSEPVQALLFSFEITESAAEEADAGIVEPNLLVRSLGSGDRDISIQDIFTDDASLIASADAASDSEETTIADIDEDVDAIAQFIENPTDLNDRVEARSLSEAVEDTSANESNPPKSAALERASLPYPWSIAVPKSTDKSEDTSPSLQEAADLEQPGSALLEVEEATTEDCSVEEPAVNQISEQIAEPESTSSISSISRTDRSVKDGVVKLLFTIKEGNYHGYIEPKDGSSDILFHQKYINSDIFDSLERGVEVVVSVKYREGKAYATKIELAR